MKNEIKSHSSNQLYELKSFFNFLINSFQKDIFPNVLMISGKKGIGKFTLTKHFMCYLFDKSNYNIKENIINSNSTFFQKFLNNTLDNIIYLKGDNFKGAKTENIRELKSKVLKKSLSGGKRFIILDDIELFNNHSLNALLKLLEEPPKNNHFVLINNQSKSLLNTIYSRSLNLKLYLSNDQRVKIIETLIKKNNLEVLINYNLIHISPGNFLNFNEFCKIGNINIKDSLIKNLEIIFKMFKKEKNTNLINFALFLVDNHFYESKEKKKTSIEKIINDRSFVIKNINNFTTYNINSSTIMNNLNNRINE